MKKTIRKILTLGFALIMLFSLAACNLDDGLAEYKANAKTEIQTYADNKIAENGYTEQDLQVIEQAVAKGKTAVDAAETKKAVDDAVKNAKDEIEAVKKNLELTDELENRIKADYLEQFGYELFFGDELLNKFYGIYNGAAVFFIAGADAWLKSATISGIEFHYTSDWKIWVWKDGAFYDLEEITTIFDAGILTQDDLEQIGIAHAEAHARG